ncbi:MAG: ResB-like family cytochrome C biogenesis protein [Desulfuromonadaceae bacterium]|nr:ResB-like family cytochrome C biogenesis protein [Desulfuromonadaceae bacterium]MDD2856167.1 ResB-like family cytochrome C biogenesis protein [Desulfuromonadaceae bacterium]
MPPSSSERVQRIIKYLASTELAVALFLLISIVAIPGTLINDRSTYSSPLFLLLLVLFSINLMLCTVRRYRSLSWQVLVVHAGVIVTLIGCVVASYGFVATVNLYEASMVDRAFRWDKKGDFPLGVNLELKKINWEYYPMPVKIGVLKGVAKEKLFELKTGESFDFNGYRIAVGAVEYNTENLKLSVYKNVSKIGTFNTLSSISDLPPDFPYSFKLVAYKTPKLKRQWVDLRLKDLSGVVAEGTSEINSPFQWGGLYFFNTLVERDKNGVAYAGIQIVRDPGRWLVFCGMTIVALGACLTTFRRWHAVR